MSDKKVSVIIPVYRTEKYLEKCVRSVLEQTYTNLEVILVDDGSDDNCPALCDGYAKEDGRVTVIHKENGGLSDARNAGLAVATGDYVTFLDSDDYIDADMYSYMMGEMGESEIVVCGVRKVSGDKTENLPNFDRKTVLSGDEAVKELFKDGKLKNYVSNKIFLRSLFDGVLFPKGLNFEDISTVYKPFMKAKKITLLPESKLNYLCREGSISKTLSVKNLYHRYRSHFLRYEDVKDIYPEAREELLRQMMYSARALALGILSENSFDKNEDIVKELTSFYSENRAELERVSLFNKFEKKQAACLAGGTKEDYKKLKSTDFLRKVNKLMKG